MQFELHLDDDISASVDWIIANKPKWFGSSLQSTGWWAQKQIKAGIVSAAPAGRPYVSGMKPSRRREIEDGMASRNPSREKNVKSRFYKLGELRKAVGYDANKVNEGVVKVGWLSRSAVRLGTWQEKGMFQPVTEKMRRMFFAAGIGLRKDHNSIAVPVRSTYEVLYPKIQSGAPAYMKEKMMGYLSGNSERSALRRRRKYRVYK
jgi:hypothetical protein